MFIFKFGLLMIITKIEQGKKNKDRVNIFLDNQFWISLDKISLIDLNLFKGKEIDLLEKTNTENESVKGKLIEKTLKFISLRPRSINEVFVYLTLRKEIPQNQAEEVINILLEKNFLNDFEFAKWFIKNRIDFGFNGVNKIKAELIAKKVSTETISKALKEFDFQNESQKILEFIEKNSKKIRAKDDLDLKKKLISRLLSKGFSYDQIKKALDSKLT